MKRIDPALRVLRALFALVFRLYGRERAQRLRPLRAADPCPRCGGYLRTKRSGEAWGLYCSRCSTGY